MNAILDVAAMNLDPSALASALALAAAASAWLIARLLDAGEPR